MNGWATFEYEGPGKKTIGKGGLHPADADDQAPRSPCSEDFEVLEIVSPADFKTKVVEGTSGRGRGGGVGLLPFLPLRGGKRLRTHAPRGQTFSSFCSERSGRGIFVSGKLVGQLV